MKNIFIKGSHDIFFVPTVDFNAETGVCKLSGESYLEETVEFYAPLIKWLEDYTNIVDNPLAFNFKLTYFNTSSSRSILDILNVLKDYEEKGGKVAVSWYYDPSDTDMEEEVEDFMQEADIKINLIQMSEAEMEADAESNS